MNKKSYLTLREIVSRNIKTIRIESGMTQSELAKRCGFKKQYISRLERIPQNINLDILEKISKAFEKPVSDLISIQSTNPKSEGIAPQIKEAIRQLKIVQARIGV